VFANALRLRQGIDSVRETRLNAKYLGKNEANDNKYYGPKTQYNFKKLREILKKNNISLVCVQYPTRELKPLKKIFKPNEEVVFVDNEKSFKDAVAREGYDAYFIDNVAGDFGHCTYKGNRLLANNIAETIIKEYFSK